MTEPAAVGIDELVLQLHEVGAVKFGSFTLKSGIQSPIYIDLRVIVSFPSLLKAVSRCMWDVAGAHKSDILCGVPYTALPVATQMSLEHDVPMVMRRKEAKNYGTKKIIEGAYTPGQMCLVVEDLVTSGGSVMETVAPLKEVGLQVQHCVVLIDREQGGRQNLSNHGITLHSVLTLRSVVAVLEKEGRIDKATAEAVRAFLSGGSTAAAEQKTSVGSPAAAPAGALTLQQRLKLTQNACAQQLFAVMIAKQSNLCVAVDVTKKEELFALVHKVGPYICLLKTHIDILEDFDQHTGAELLRLAQKYNFLIFEDRKYADIGNTVMLQYSAGVHRTVEWAHVVNAHVIPGPGIIDGLQKASAAAKQEHARGLLLLAQMSSKGSLATGSYTSEAVKMALLPEYKLFVIGFICQARLCDDPTMLHMTPGVNLAQSGDAMGQQYRTPEDAVVRDGCDIIIVGRGVYKAADPAAAAQKYQKAGWEALSQRATA